MKAATCRAGREAMIAFCDREGIAYDLCGKVIVAVDEAELSRLEGLVRRGTDNGVSCELVNRAATARPGAPRRRHRGYPRPRHRHRGLQTGLRKAGEHPARARLRDHDRRACPRPDRAARQVTVRTDGEELEAQVVVNCAGLHSDRVAKLGDSQAPAAIIPFRGEYYALKPEMKHLCRNLIYPVPDPQFPFLGVHFTRMIDGSVECGPNAVLALRARGLSQDRREPARYG